MKPHPICLSIRTACPTGERARERYPWLGVQPGNGSANIFPATHVMISLYYANYAVPTHGQWCILMAMAAQRGAVTIDQSCFGYGNSSVIVDPANVRKGDEERWWRGRGKFVKFLRSRV